MSLVVQALSTLVMTVTIAFQLHPTLGFCVLPIAPIVISVAVINVIITEKQVAREKVTADEISRAAFEAYSHFTTVAVLGREKVVVTGLEKKLEGPHRFAQNFKDPYFKQLKKLLHQVLGNFPIKTVLVAETDVLDTYHIFMGCYMESHSPHCILHTRVSSTSEHKFYEETRSNSVTFSRNTFLQTHAKLISVKTGNYCI